MAEGAAWHQASKYLYEREGRAISRKSSILVEAREAHGTRIGPEELLFMANNAALVQGCPCQ